MLVRSIPVAVTLLLALNVSEKAGAQAPFDISSVDFAEPEFVQYLINDQYERVEIQGLGGLYYGLGAYIRGIGKCPALLARSPASLLRLSEPLSFGLIIRIFEQRLKMDEAADLTELIAIGVEGPILAARMLVGRDLGIFDAEALISKRGCLASETVRFVAAAEKLAEALLVVSDEGEKPYERPASLAGLPEETQRLYDEYYLCRVRTRTFYMVPGGITDPCDEDFFEFNASRAKATGQPAPTRNFTLWLSGQGVVGKYEERPIGISIVFDEAPENFTPDIPDSLLTRAGSPCRNCEASTEGWLVGSSIRFRLNHNTGRRGRLRNVTLRLQGYSDWSERSWMLTCDYVAGDRLVTEVNYWHRTMPGAAQLERLSNNLGRRLPTIIGAREQCPVTLPDDIKVATLAGVTL